MSTADASRASAGVVAGGANGAVLGGVAAPGAPSAAAAAADPGAAALAMVQNLPDAAGSEVAALEARHREILAERRVVAQRLKNEKAKQKRLLTKARGLDDAQLMSIIASRAAAKAKAKGKAKAKAKA